LDPFGGSGTTSMVAVEMGRDSIMIDLKPEYIGLALQRLGKGNR
jgi:site-specific DNA-methyltransferase (adenine-specific)